MCTAPDFSSSSSLIHILMSPSFNDCSMRIPWQMQGTEGSTRRWKFIKVTDSQLGIVWYYMQGNSTCLSRKSIAHFVRKLSQDLSFGQGTISRVGFLHWDRHTLKISQIAQYEPPETIPFVLHNTVRVHFEVVHGYSFHTERQSRKKQTLKCN